MKKTLLLTMTAALACVTVRAQENTTATTNAPANAAPETTSPTTNPATAESMSMTHSSTTPQPMNGAPDLDHRFEAGLVIGEPTGASVKYWFNNTLAIDGAFGWSFHHDTDFTIQSDVLWHKYDLFHVSQGALPLYFGVGGRVKFRDNQDDEAGIRVPVGVTYLFPDIPVSLFAEVAPVLDVTPSVRGGFTAGIGARYRF
jgi:hypothetical protein